MPYRDERAGGLGALLGVAGQVLRHDRLNRWDVSIKGPATLRDSATCEGCRYLRRVQCQAPGQSTSLKPYSLTPQEELGSLVYQGVRPQPGALTARVW